MGAADLVVSGGLRQEAARIVAGAPLRATQVIQHPRQLVLAAAWRSLESRHRRSGRKVHWIGAAQQWHGATALVVRRLACMHLRWALLCISTLRGFSVYFFHHLDCLFQTKDVATCDVGMTQAWRQLGCAVRIVIIALASSDERQLRTDWDAQIDTPTDAAARRAHWPRPPSSKGEVAKHSH